MTGTTTPHDGRLLDTAESLIREEGADGWTLADLAAEAEVEVAEIEAVYSSEWEVFAALIRRDDESFESVFESPKDESPGQRIVAVFEAIVPNYDWTLWIELWSLALRDERANALRIELDQRFRALLEEIIRDGTSSGEFEVSDPTRTALTIATLIDSMATNATLGDATVRPNYMLDACVTVTGELLGAELALPAREGFDD